MKTFEAGLKDINSEMRFYEVIPVDKCIQEDGTYTSAELAGYGVRNKETGVIEHTTTMLPGAIYQSTYLDKALVSLIEGENPVGEDGGAVAEDVVFN